MRAPGTSRRFAATLLLLALLAGGVIEARTPPPPAPKAVPEHAEEAFYQALSHGNLDFVERLLSTRPDRVNLRFEAGFTPLHVAVQADRLEMIELLIDRGAQVDARTDWGLTPAHLAVDHGLSCRQLLCLVYAGANLDEVDNDGETPLHRAIRKRSVPQARMLVFKGASLARKDGSGRTALALARLVGPKEMVDFLTTREASK